MGDLHFNGAAPRYQLGLEEDVPGDVDGVLEVALDLVQDVLGGAPEQDGAGLGVLALLDEGEVLVADLPDLEETRAQPDVLLGDLVGPVHDGGAAGPGHSQVVGLSEPSDHGDVGLQLKY